MDSKREVFALLDSGEVVEIFTLTTESISVSVITFGACITNFQLLSKNLDVALSYRSDALDGYVENPYKVGATVGRVANRIRNGQFQMDGDTYCVDKNLEGKHSHHGGRKCFSHYNWKVKEDALTSNSVTFYHLSPDGDMGYPGAVKIEATYSVKGDCLTVEYKATCDAPTPINVTNHCYFNLAGHSAGKMELRDHVFQIHSDEFLATDEDTLPVAREKVAGGVMDLRQPKRLGDVLDNVNNGIGFDNYYCFSEFGDTETVRASATYKDVTLELFCNQPGVAFYTGYYTDVRKGGKEGATYGRHEMFAFEAHGYPDAVNHPEFPDTVVRPGQEYYNKIIFKLYTK